MTDPAPPPRQRLPRKAPSAPEPREKGAVPSGTVPFIRILSLAGILLPLPSRLFHGRLSCPPALQSGTHQHPRRPIRRCTRTAANSHACPFLPAFQPCIPPGISHSSGMTFQGAGSSASPCITLPAPAQRPAQRRKPWAGTARGAIDPTCAGCAAPHPAKQPGKTPAGRQKKRVPPGHPWDLNRPSGPQT